MKILDNKEPDIYNMYDYDTNKPLSESFMTNKLFCTFTIQEDLDNLIEHLSTQYNILYNKMFVLNVTSNDEYVVTYNVEQGNINSIPDNTILVHRKKESNTLYTINALNELIKGLNEGVMDSHYQVTWQDYRNCILLTQHSELKQLNTKIYKIIDL